jgi:hypothetical protein
LFQLVGLLIFGLALTFISEGPTAALPRISC